MNNTLAYIILIIVILIADIIWLNVQKPRYNSLVTAVQGSQIKVKYTPAFFTYILVVISILFIAIPLVRMQLASDIKNKSTGHIFMTSLVYGGLVGLCIYGIFNFTNMSIFKDYKLSVAVMDTTWGVVLYTLSCFLFFMMSK
jgi:uncharacterized membrane protein